MWIVMTESMLDGIMVLMPTSCVHAYSLMLSDVSRFSVISNSYASILIEACPAIAKGLNVRQVKRRVLNYLIHQSLEIHTYQCSGKVQQLQFPENFLWFKSRGKEFLLKSRFDRLNTPLLHLTYGNLSDETRSGVPNHRFIMLTGNEFEHGHKLPTDITLFRQQPWLGETAF